MRPVFCAFVKIFKQFCSQDFLFVSRLLYRNEIMTASTPKAVPVTLLSGFLVGSLMLSALSSLIRLTLSS